MRRTTITLVIAAISILALIGGVYVLRPPRAFFPPTVPACIRNAADFPLPSDQVCGGKMKCDYPNDYGKPSAGTINKVDSLICCPTGYNVDFVKNSAGENVAAFCAKGN